MRMNLFLKNAVCFMFVIAVASLAAIPAFAVDLAYLDEHGEEGQELWEAYKTELEPLRSGVYPTVDETMDMYTERKYSKYYEEITGRPQEEFNSLSTYDKVLLASTFIEPYYINDLGQTYNNDTEWTYATDTFNMMFGVCCDNNKDMKSAYNKLMYWQYRYYQSSGAFYNFVEGRDSLDYLNDKYVEDMKKDTENSVTSKATSSSSETTSYVSSEVKEDKGIWSDFIDKVKSHIFTITLLCAFVVAGAVIGIRKKRVNAQNDNVQ